MNTIVRLSRTLAAVAIAILSSPAHADSSDAMCQVRKDGDTKQGKSGPCTFSQRQGYIDIDLRNGDTFSLSPGGKANHYKDQKGIKVVRTSATASSQEFRWEGGKKITVTFAAAPAYSRPATSSYTAGATAPDLADLVGAKGGQAEGELERRGYAYANGSTAGNARYSAWYNRSTGRCVMIRTEEGRYQSIVEAPPSDCGR